MLKVLDLFSGIGGFSLGLERTGGFQTVAFCEINPFCRRVLAKHWPKVPCYHDIRELTGQRLLADGIHVDAICGGFPCPDISIAGRGLGIEGPRSGLWHHYARLIDEIRPSVVIVENVAALLIRGMGTVLAGLSAIGYDAEWSVIPACAMGAPHTRERVWVVAYPQCKRLSGLGKNQRLFGAAEETYAKHFNSLLGAWSALDMDTASLRKCDGVPRSAHRLEALGNAVVPQIPEMIGRAILAVQHDVAGGV